MLAAKNISSEFYLVILILRLPSMASSLKHFSLVIWGIYTIFDPSVILYFYIDPY